MTDAEAPPRDGVVRDPHTHEPLPDQRHVEPVQADPPLCILVVDNYDSFTYNLVQYLGELGAEPIVHRNDAVTLDEVEAMRPDGIVISPGPGNPKNDRDFGVSGPILQGPATRTPTLGVCLGLQGFAWLYGGDVTYAHAVMHGKTSTTEHDGKGVFAGIPNPLTVGRYHSLVADPDKIPDVLEVSARSTDGEIMGLRHRQHPIECVQFHPESILTAYGKELMRNFLQRCLDARSSTPTRDDTTPEATS